MTVSEQLLSNFPNSINKEGKFFNALIGACSKVLNESKKYADEYTGTPNLYEQTGEMLQKTANFISYLEQYTDETDDAFKKRLHAIFARNNDKVFGTPLNIIHVFNAYFSNANIYLAENTGNIDTENLLLNPDFQIESSWIINGNCNYSKNARFSQSYGIDIKSGGSISQTIEDEISATSYIVKDGDTYELLAKNNYGSEDYADYIKNYNDNPEEITVGDSIEIPSKPVYNLHFFLKGKCKVEITNSKGQYFNNSISFDPETRKWTYGKWESNVIQKDFDTGDRWDNCSLFINGNYSNENVTIKFIGIDNGYIDYTRLFLYKNPSFTVIAQYEGNSNQDSAALAPGHDDTTASQEAIDNYSFYSDENNNISFVSGVNNGGYSQDLYKELLTYVKASGVEAFIEIVNRDE